MKVQVILIACLKKYVSNFKRECFVEKKHTSRRLCDTCTTLHVRSIRCVDIFNFMEAVCVVYGIQYTSFAVFFKQENAFHHAFCRNSDSVDLESDYIRYL